MSRDSGAGGPRESTSAGQNQVYYGGPTGASRFGTYVLHTHRRY